MNTALLSLLIALIIDTVIGDRDATDAQRYLSFRHIEGEGS